MRVFIHLYLHRDAHTHCLIYVVSFLPTARLAQSEALHLLAEASGQWRAWCAVELVVISGQGVAC